MAQGKRRQDLPAGRRGLPLASGRKKAGKPPIDKQFEYNTYIRDFFAANPGKTLPQAILCWKRKKALAGHNRYEAADLAALNE